MAYFEQIKQSKTWVCPKSGYYKIVCVGGGGGGGGAGYYSPGVTNPSTSAVTSSQLASSGAYDLAILYSTARTYPSPYDTIKTLGKLEYKFTNIFKNFFKEGVKFVSSCSGGSQGGSGGSTSFGNILTAVGGAGGAGGGAEYGSTIKKSFLSPQGGKSVTSPGGSGASLTSCYTSKGYLKIPYMTTINDRVYNFNDCPEYRPLKPLILPYNFGIDGVSACSGAGGAGGDIETIITFIEKGTEIPCAIGAGGAGGKSGSVQINNQIEYPSVSINTVVSTYQFSKKVISKTFQVNGRPEVDSSLSFFTYENMHTIDGEKDLGESNDYIRVTIPSYTPFRLEASIPGGGGGGGFTLTQSGGVGSSLDVFNSYKTLNGEIALPFVDSTVVERRTHSLNGGEPNCNGVGYGAGGAGGNNVTKFCLGTDKSNEEVAYVQKAEGESTNTYAQYTGAITLPIVDFSGFPRTLEPSSGNAGVDGYICIQEVS